MLFDGDDETPSPRASIVMTNQRWVSNSLPGPMDETRPGRAPEPGEDDESVRARSIEYAVGPIPDPAVADHLPVLEREIAERPELLFAGVNAAGQDQQHRSEPWHALIVECAHRWNAMSRYLQRISLRPYDETDIWVGWEIEERSGEIEGLVLADGMSAEDLARYGVIEFHKIPTGYLEAGEFLPRPGQPSR